MSTHSHRSHRASLAAFFFFFAVLSASAYRLPERDAADIDGTPPLYSANSGNLIGRRGGSGRSDEVKDGPPFAPMGTNRRPTLCSACKLLMEEMSGEVSKRLLSKDFSLLATTESELKMRKEVVKVALSDVCKHRFFAWARKSSDFHFALPHYHRCANTGAHACMNVEAPFLAGTNIDAERSYICKYYMDYHGDFLLDFFLTYPLEVDTLPEYDLGEHFCYDHIGICTEEEDPYKRERRERDPYEHTKFGKVPPGSSPLEKQRAKEEARRKEEAVKRGEEDWDESGVGSGRGKKKSVLQSNRDKAKEMKARVEKDRMEAERLARREALQGDSRLQRMREKYDKMKGGGNSASTGFGRGTFTPGQYVTQSGHAARRGEL